AGPDDPAANLARLAQVLGSDFSENALPVAMAREGFSLTGHVGLPTFHRGAANHIHFTVNGRPVRDRLLLGAVRGAYADTLRSDRHPVLGLAIACEPGLVDVNVHPAKTEVRFRDPGLVRALVVSAIHEALRRGGVRASTGVAARTLDALRPSGGLPLTQHALTQHALTQHGGAASPSLFQAARTGAFRPGTPSVAAPSGFHRPAPNQAYGFGEAAQAAFDPAGDLSDPMAGLAEPTADLAPPAVGSA
ncbi:DNA mismatch repair protein MutL, partial [Methylobacterium sp. WL103]